MIGAVFALRGGLPGMPKTPPFIAAAQGPTKVQPPSDATVSTPSDAGAIPPQGQHAGRPRDRGEHRRATRRSARSDSAAARSGGGRAVEFVRFLDGAHHGRHAGRGHDAAPPLRRSRRPSRSRSRSGPSRCAPMGRRFRLRPPAPIRPSLRPRLRRRRPPRSRPRRPPPALALNRRRRRSTCRRNSPPSPRPASWSPRPTRPLRPMRPGEPVQLGATSKSERPAKVKTQVAAAEPEATAAAEPAAHGVRRLGGPACCAPVRSRGQKRSRQAQREICFRARRRQRSPFTRRPPGATRSIACACPGFPKRTPRRSAPG